MLVNATLSASFHTPSGLVPVEACGTGTSKTEARIRADASLREKLRDERNRLGYTATVTIHAVQGYTYEHIND